MKHIQTRHLIGAALFTLVACQSTLTGNEGNFQFSYTADDWLTDFNKPIAVGAYLDLSVREVGTALPVDLTAASYDDESVLSVLDFADDTITVQGMADGTALLQVEGVTQSGAALTDSVNMLAATPEVLYLGHTCDTGATAAYLTGQRAWVAFEMEKDNGQPVIGYGYYPVTLDTDAAALNEDESTQQWMAFDTSTSAGSLVVSSEIDDTSFYMEVVEPGDIDGVQEPIPWVWEDIDVGDVNAFFVRPMVEDLVVCQADLAKTVSSDTPDICDVRDSDPETTSGEGEHEFGWFQVEGLAEGTCLYTVTYADAAGGAGVSAQFSFEIQP